MSGACCCAAGAFRFAVTTISTTSARAVFSWNFHELTISLHFFINKKNRSNYIFNSVKCNMISLKILNFQRKLAALFDWAHTCCPPTWNILGITVQSLGVISADPVGLEKSSEDGGKGPWTTAVVRTQTVSQAKRFWARSNGTIAL